MNVTRGILKLKVLTLSLERMGEIKENWEDLFIIYGI